MTMSIEVRRQSPQLARARSVLAALSDRPGPPGIAAVEAFCVLDDVAPPYPPLQELSPGTPVTDQDAIDALQAAIDDATDNEELARLAGAAQALRNPPTTWPWPWT